MLQYANTIYQHLVREVLVEKNSKAREVLELIGKTPSPREFARSRREWRQAWRKEN